MPTTEISADNGSHTLVSPLSGEPALLVSGNGNEIVSFAGLSSDLAGPAVRLTGSDTYLRNESSISAAGGVAIAGSAYTDTIINRGAITGSVELGGGADYFQNNLGAPVGDVFGGGGDDALITYFGSVALRYWARPATTTLPAAARTTFSTAASARTSSRAGTGTTSSPVAPEPTGCRAATATMCSRAAAMRADIALYAGYFADFSVAVAGGSGTVLDNNAADGDEGSDTLTGISLLRFADEQVDVRVARSSLVLAEAGQSYANGADRYDQVAVELGGAGSTLVNTAAIRGTAVPHAIEHPSGGSIAAQTAVIAVRADDVTIDNRAGATISGFGNAINANGDWTTGENGLYLPRADNLVVINLGAITSTEGEAVSGALQLTVSNGASGLIEGEVAAITARNGVAIIDNAGLVRGGDVAIFTSYLDLTNSGTIEGGVRSASMSSSIENSGTITGGYQAYGGLSLLNSGTSAGDLAIDVRPAGYSSFGLTLASIDNRGTFAGDIRISGEAQFHSGPTAHAVYVTLVANSGTLTGDIVSDPTLATLAGGAVPDASFSERVTNTGTIDGNVLLGDGDDEVTNGGSITGAVELGAGRDRYEGGAGADRADGGDGDDRLAGGAGDDLLVGGLGNDYLHGGAGADGMDGGAGDDTYVVDDLRDTVTEAAGGGHDTVHSAIDYVLGADVEDLVLSGTGAIGGAGNGVRNAITGNGAANGLGGGGGDDVLWGLGGADTLDGQGGDDALWGGLGHDQLMGGGGADTLDGEGGNDRVDGNAGADFVNGGLGNDNVFGGADDDRVHGGHGADLVNGHAGDDLIVGGPGSDLLVGGLGADRFLFSEGHLGGGLSATDRIKDFSSAQGDLIDFRPLDAVSTAAGDQAFTWIGNAAFSGTAGELRYNWAGNTTVVTGDRDGDGTADFALWLTGQIGLTEGDFLL